MNTYEVKIYCKYAFECGCGSTATTTVQAGDRELALHKAFKKFSLNEDDYWYLVDHAKTIYIKRVKN